MKNLKKTLMLLVLGGLIATTSCKKQGETGPVGPAGSAGTAGVDGINGADGTNNYVSAADQTAYTNADGIQGGKLYDKFYTIIGTTDPEITGNGNFFRCKQCHGWDLIGSMGAYIDRAPNATRPNVAPLNIRTFATKEDIRTIYDAIKNTGGRSKDNLVASNKKSLNDDHPDYGVIMSDADIWDLVKFIKQEAYNTYNLYDINTSGTYPTGTKTFTNVGKDGSSTAGNTYYSNNCTSCHGADGTAFAMDGGALYVGDFMRNKPYEFQHKIKFGQPGSSMNGFSAATETDIKDLLVAGQDTIAYPSF